MTIQEMPETLSIPPYPIKLPFPLRKNSLLRYPTNMTPPPPKTSILCDAPSLGLNNSFNPHNNSAVLFFHFTVGETGVKGHEANQRQSWDGNLHRTPQPPKARLLLLTTLPLALTPERAWPPKVNSLFRTTAPVSQKCTRTY